MKLKTKLMMCTAAFVLAAGMANAAITATDVVKSYQDAAYTHIEVVEGPTQIKVEAIKDGSKIEVVYDKATGDVISTETKTILAGNGDEAGVEVSTSGEDFVDGTDASSGSDDQADDNSGSDEQAGEDDSHNDQADDNSGSGDQAGEDASHDDQAGDNSGSDEQAGQDDSHDDQGDDNGGDSSGSGGEDHSSDEHESGENG